MQVGDQGLRLDRDPVHHQPPCGRKPVLTRGDEFGGSAAADENRVRVRQFGQPPGQVGLDDPYLPGQGQRLGISPGIRSPVRAPLHPDRPA